MLGRAGAFHLPKSGMVSDEMGLCSEGCFVQ